MGDSGGETDGDVGDGDCGGGLARVVRVARGGITAALLLDSLRVIRGFGVDGVRRDSLSVSKKK